MRKALLLVLALAVAAAACMGDTPGEPAQGPEGGIDSLSVVRVLVDGQYVTCVLYSQVNAVYNAGMGGLSCDWGQR